MIAIVSRRRVLQGASGIAGATLAGPARAARFSLRCANNMPATHPLSLRMKEAFDNIRAESGGEVSMELFANGQAGNDTDMLTQLVGGQLDFAAVPAQVLGSVVPVAAITSVGFAFKSYDAIWPALDGPLGARIRDDIAAAGLAACGRVWDDGFHQITLRNKVLNKLVDIKNVRLRVANGPVSLVMFRDLGAAPAAMSFGDLLPALETHIFDAEENTLTVIDAAKIYRQTPFCSITNHMWDGFWMLANAAGFAVLPVGIRDLITRNLDAAGLAQRDDIRALEAGMQSKLTSAGMTFNTPVTSEFRAALSSAGFYATWKRRFGPNTWSLLEQSTGALA